MFNLINLLNKYDCKKWEENDNGEETNLLSLSGLTSLVWTFGDEQDLPNQGEKYSLCVFIFLQLYLSIILR